MLSSGRLAIVISALVCASPIPALALPAPNGCWHRTRLSPPRSSTIPANLPGFVLRPSNAHGIGERPIDAYRVELRDRSGALVPATIQAQGDRSYLIKPDAALPLGSLALSLLEDCPEETHTRLPEPVRKDHLYNVTAAVPIPSRLGTLDAQVVGYRAYPFLCPDPIYGKVLLTLRPSAEAEAFRAAVELTMHLPDGLDLPLWPEQLPRSGAFEHETEVACRESTGSSEPRTIELRARLPGSGQEIEPLRATVNIDCTKRVLEGEEDVCAGEPGQQPPGSGANRPDSGVDPRGSGADPRGSATDDPRPSGGGCRVGPVDGPAPAPLLLLALAAIAGQLARRRRAVRRPSPGPSPPPGRARSG